MEWKQYKRKGLSEMVTYVEYDEDAEPSVSEQDLQLPQEEFNRGWVARNPKNHLDVWYVAAKYFDENLEPAEPPQELPLIP